jgi:hypothetical protein
MLKDGRPLRIAVFFVPNKKRRTFHAPCRKKSSARITLCSGSLSFLAYSVWAPFCEGLIVYCTAMLYRERRLLENLLHKSSEAIISLFKLTCSHFYRTIVDKRPFSTAMLITALLKQSRRIQNGICPRGNQSWR